MQAKIEPNNKQFAIAQYLAVAVKDEAHPRLVCQVPPGQGKSRIAATAALINLLSMSESTDKVHMVYPSEYLLQRDLCIFEKYWTFNKLQERVQYHVGLEFTKNENELIIVDESDHVLFKEPKLFNEFIGKNPCICLTATPGNNSDGVEKKVLEHLGFKVIGDEKDSDSNKIQIDKEIDQDDLDSLLQEYQYTSPVLLFCNEQLASCLSDLYSDTSVQDDAILRDDVL